MNQSSLPAMDALARRALAAMDLTSLGEDDERDRITGLCASARTPFGAPAALCVYPEWIATCREELARLGLSGVAVASVVNFPDGSADLERVVRETRRAVAAGAGEIDMVFPYRAFAAGDRAAGSALVQACKAACGARARLKVILETGALESAALIRAAAECALLAGADFLKTSTGKVAVNATPAAARTMLEVVRAHGGHCGFKAAGGIRTLADAALYFELADELMGPGWATPQHFRLGASALLADVLAHAGASPTDEVAGAAAGKY